jgi:hypothetical protein
MARDRDDVLAETEKSPYVEAIECEMRKAQERNTREHGYEWNRDSHGLIRALEAVRRVDGKRRS